MTNHTCLLKISLWCLLLFFQLGCNMHLAKQPIKSVKLWYSQPANASIADHPNGWHNDPEWLKALPLGNGSLGLMVFGDVNKERIQLNEESMWSGSHDANDNPEAFEHQAKIRQLLFEGKYREATELTNKTQICKGPGSGRGNGATVPFGCFQTLGDLWLDFEKNGSYENYYRELDLNNAVARVRYTQNGVNFEREIFTSQPDQVMVARFTADKPGQISFNCSMTRPERFKTHTEDGQLILSGALFDGKGGENLHYMARLKAVNKNGEVTCNDSVLSIKNADEVVLLLSASTDYKLEYPTYKGRDYVNITKQNIEKASQKKYADLYKAHTDEYGNYFNRVSLQLGSAKKDTVPTDQRVQRYKETKNDQHLCELIFQYGRYLLISSSRPGTLPANLQGIWANKIQTPWNGDYHTDVNLEMNYWPAEVTNLSEMHLPLFDLIAALVEPGAQTAQIQYRSKGWVVHPITNVWGYTSPGEVAAWGMHTGAPAWICQHIGEHYRFTGDTAFIEKMYPVLKGAIEFYMDWLVVHPETGKLVSGPAVSPENTFIAPDGSHCQISMGPTHDQQVIWQLFDDFAMISKVLSYENDFIADVEKAKNQLAGTQIGSDGRLLEWAKEYPEAEPGHRHISHLFDVHPGARINPIQTPDLAKAAEKSLIYRLENDKHYGAASIGWSAAWQISLNARLHRAEKAMESLHLVLSQSVHPNLFGNCPPFQMDNNFGTTAGIAEMLLQSHVQNKDGLYIIHLLPALPALWSEGSVSGLKARGNVKVDVSWNNNLTKAVITPATLNPFILRYGNVEIEVKPQNTKPLTFTAKEFKK
jgi:alpha-L-fucosidase 2